MKRTARGIALALGIALLAAPAHADDAQDRAAEARQQYQLGTQAFSHKRYSEAALHFEAAAAAKASAIALYTAGLAWDLASQPERAADAYARALDVTGLDPKQTSTATERLDTLEKSLGTLAVTAPEGWRVQLDGFTEVMAPARLHGAPGVRTLTVRAPDKPIQRHDVTLEAGRVATFDVTDEPERQIEVEPVAVVEPPEPAPLEPPREPFWSTLRVVGVGVAGVGVAALGAGAVLGVNANGAKDAYDAAPSRAAFDHASALETWTNVALVSGAVLAAGGVALIVLPLRSDSAGQRVEVGAAPGGLVVSGAF